MTGDYGHPLMALKMGAGHQKGQGINLRDATFSLTSQAPGRGEEPEGQLPMANGVINHVQVMKHP